MAVSFEIDTHGLLNRWQIRMLENIWNYNQIMDASEPSFRGVYLQRDREVIAHALADAFETVATYLGYWPQPVYVSDQHITLDPEKPWYAQTLNLGTRYLETFGRRQVEYISTMALDFEGRQDRDEDGFAEIAELELELPDHLIGADYNAWNTYLPSNAHLFREVLGAADPRYEVPYLRFYEPGDFFESQVLQCDVHLAVMANPNLQDNTPYTGASTRRSLDREDIAIYAQGVDVYHVTTNTEGAVQLLCLPESGSEIEAIEVEPLIVNSYYTDFRLLRGSVEPKGKPYAVRVSYRAGYPLGAARLMDSQLEQAIIRLANTDISMRDLPLSHRTNEVWDDDQHEVFGHLQYIPRDYINPLGTRRGHLETWNILKRYIDPLLGRPEG